MQNQERPRLEQLAEDLAIVKNEIIHIRRDLTKLLSILYESDESIVSRVRVNESRLDELQKAAWHSKTALASATIAIIGTIVNIILTRK